MDTTANLTIRRVPLDSLELDPANARSHGERNLEAIQASLARFGQAEPLVVHAKTGRVIGGNGRLVAMRAMGWNEADIVELDVDDLEATALGIALNRTGELAEWDAPALGRLLEQLREEDALLGVGYDDSEINALLDELTADLDPVEIDDPGPGEPPVVPTTRSGDLWILGDHRLLCGDSTRSEDVQRVLMGEKAALCATDPPYLVDYTGERPNDTGKDWSDTYKEVEIEDAPTFFRAVFTNVLDAIGPNAAIYCWHAHKRCGLIQSVWEELGIVDHQQVVWIKPASVFGRVYWHFRHEPCMMGWRQGSKPEHDGQHQFDSVWECDYDGLGRRAAEHPTCKPLELFRRPMLKHTKARDIVFEPFSGSGSQIIAAEELGRRCRAIEIEPAFVDVAVRRWETATGKPAVLEENGQPFGSVKEERQ